MNRLALTLALAGTVLLPTLPAFAQCFTGGAEGRAADDEADAAASEEAASGALVRRLAGTVWSLSADVTVSAPDTPEGHGGIETVRGILAAIDAAFVTTGVRHVPPATVEVQLTATPGPVWPDGGSTSAWTTCSSRSCEILMYREGWADDGILAYTLAHEFAHVAQNLAFRRLRDPEIDWWFEGTAEWFANIVVPGQDHAAGWIADFDALSQTTAVTDMCYEAFAFFLWAGDAFGPAYPFTLGGFGEAGMRSAEAFATTLPPGSWHDFVETFLGGKLRYPDGRPAWPNPSLGPVEPIGAGVEVRIEGPTLSIPRVQLEVEPGDWEIAAEGSSPFTSFSQDGGASWFRVDNALGAARGFSVTAECEEDTRLVMASIGQAPGTFFVSAEADGEESPCLEACDRPIPEEHCMIGAWTALSTDLPDTYNMIAAAIPARSRWTDQDMGGNYVVLYPDGTYVQAITDAQSEFEHEIDGSVMRQRVFLFADAYGRWSVVDDEFLIMCTDEYVGMMINELSVGGVTQVGEPFPVPQDPAFVDGDGVRFRYTCAGDTADVSLQHFGFPRVGWDVRRVPMPPPPEEPF